MAKWAIFSGGEEWWIADGEIEEICGKDDVIQNLRRIWLKTYLKIFVWKVMFELRVVRNKFFICPFYSFRIDVTPRHFPPIRRNSQYWINQIGANPNIEASKFTSFAFNMLKYHLYLIYIDHPLWDLRNKISFWQLVILDIEIYFQNSLSQT